MLEYTLLKVSSTNESNKPSRDFWDTRLFVGAGLNITSKISVGAKYSLLYKDGESIYTSTVISFVNINFKF